MRPLLLACVSLSIMIACGEVVRKDLDASQTGDADAAPGGDGASGPQAQLSVAVSGSGSVTSDPAGIDCGATCTAMFPEGTEVQLIPAPDSAGDLERWDGACTGFGPCTIQLDEDSAVEARFARHGTVRWASQISFSGQDSFEPELLVDPDGNLIFASDVNDGDGKDLYVAKLDKITGEILWENHLDTANLAESFRGVALDTGGNVYVAMTASGLGATDTIGGTSISGDIGGNIVALRLSGATGAVLWAVQWGGTGQDRPTGVAVLGPNLFVVGETSSNPSSFAGPSIVGSTGDGFIVRAAISNGAVSQVVHLDGNIDIHDVAVASGRLAIGGSFMGSPVLDAGCSIASSAVGNDGYVAEYDPANLDCRWARDFGSIVDDMDSSTHALAAYPGGGWVATGSFEGNVLWANSGSALGSQGGFDAFAVRYDEAGDHIWSFRYGDTGFDIGADVAVTSEGNVVLAGRFESEITFGIHNLTGASDVYVTRMSPGATPTHEWAVALGGDNTDHATSIALGADAYPYVAAYFNGMTNVSGNAFTAADYDAWIAALVR